MNRAVYAVMGTVLFTALIITTAAFESVLLDRDVISEPDAGTLLGPAMIAAAVLIVLLSLLRSAAVADAVDGAAPTMRGAFPAQPADDPARRDGARPGLDPDDEFRPARAPLLPTAVATTVLVYLGMLLVGSVWYGLVRDELVSTALFAGRYALSPLVLGSALWAGLVVAGTIAVSRVEPRT
jgi:hypothetical protein